MICNHGYKTNYIIRKTINIWSTDDQFENNINAAEAEPGSGCSAHKNFWKIQISKILKFLIMNQLNDKKVQLERNIEDELQAIKKLQKELKKRKEKVKELQEELEETKHVRILCQVGGACCGAEIFKN